MAIALGRLVLLVLGRVGPVQETSCPAIRPEPDDPAAVTAPSLAAAAAGASAGAGAADFIRGPEHYFELPAIQGQPALTSFRRMSTDLQKRDCLANGTNFCFGNGNNYCGSCGTCCGESGSGSKKWCCPADGICCGSACCANGQTCNDGKCFAPVVTVTATSDVTATITQVVSNVATIVQQVVESTVINSVVENWVYVTVTTVEKRALPTAAPPGDSQGDSADAEVHGDEPPATAEADDAGEAALWRRQATAAALSAAAPTTTVNRVDTVTAVVTDIVFSTTTILTTSTVFDTLFQTNTRWPRCRRRPRTLTNLAPDAVAHAHLSASAIAGIAVGSAAFALIASLLLFAAVRRQQRIRRQRQAIEDEYAFFATGRGSGGPPQDYAGTSPPVTAGPDGPGSSDLLHPDSERGLPPVPWFSKLQRVSFAGTPAAAATTTHDDDDGGDEKHQTQPQQEASSPFLARIANMRPLSGQTAVTAGSRGSTVVGGGGGSSRRASVGTTHSPGRASGTDSNTTTNNNAGGLHERTSSSGAASGMTASTLADVDENGNGGAVADQPQPASPIQGQGGLDRLITPPRPWTAGAGGTTTTTTTGNNNNNNDNHGGGDDSDASSLHNGRRNSVVTKNGRFIYRDY
ncbi:hypothetical protein SPI_05193 [Niveomyces insectorum RCEF 264]|uniref:Uncharacterized protein n=1 Tax=Niveomyces insectorum RCEF 264 TaxID=1081102 RepID=A0A167U208_9HYPO|nr:hypothetical protein SPI_05193 [Niveomyces insectorum RCEF 264]